MNVRIIKETRALLPVFGVTLLSAIAPPLIWGRDTAQAVSMIIFTICCLLMGASCFGNEYQWRTMPLLLSQPVPRRKIWNEKMMVLGVALGLGLLTCLLCVPEDGDSKWFVVLMCVCVLCTGPYAALEVKSTPMAAMVIFGLPLTLTGVLSCLIWAGSQVLHTRYGLAVGHLLGSFLQQHSPRTGSLLEDSMDNHPYFWIGMAATIYCAVLYRLGYRKFMKLQAVDSQSREVALPTRVEAFLGRRLKGLLPGYSGPWASLFRKELQLQKAGFLVAGVGCIISLLSGLAWDVYHSDVLLGLAFAPIAIFVFVIPLITPGVCVAEERNWGVNEWQRALPMPARKQWAAKLGTVLFTCALLGVVLPAAMWLIGGWVFRLPNGVENLHSGGNPTGNDLAALFLSILIYLLVFSLGIFSSSASGTAIKAILLTIGLIMAAAGAAAVVVTTVANVTRMYGEIHGKVYRASGNSGDGGYWQFGWSSLALMGLVQYLAYANYRKGEPGTRRLWIQLAAVAGSIGVVYGVCAVLN